MQRDGRWVTEFIVLDDNNNDNPCPGSHKLPLNVSKCSTSMADSSGPHVSNSAMLDACQVQFSPIWSPGEVTLIKHIPKSARVTCALHFLALLRSVATNPGYVSNWTALFNRGAAILYPPKRGGKCHNLSSTIKAAFPHLKPRRRPGSCVSQVK